jgi:hypothetical protein
MRNLLFALLLAAAALSGCDRLFKSADSPADKPAESRSRSEDSPPAAEPAPAKPTSNFDGTYVYETQSQAGTVKISGLRFSATVGTQRGCTAEAGGDLSPTGYANLFNYSPPSGSGCRLDIEIHKGFLVVAETGDCVALHGAGCSLSGKYYKR